MSGIPVSDAVISIPPNPVDLCHAHLHAWENEHVEWLRFSASASFLDDKQPSHDEAFKHLEQLLSQHIQSIDIVHLVLAYAEPPFVSSTTRSCHLHGSGQILLLEPAMPENAQTIAVSGRATCSFVSCSQVTLMGCPTGCTASSMKFPDRDFWQTGPVIHAEDETLFHNIVFYPNGEIPDDKLRAESELFLVDVRKMFAEQQREKRTKSLGDARNQLKEMTCSSSLDHTAADRAKQEAAIVEAEEALNDPLQVWGPLNRIAGAAWWNGSKLRQVKAFYVLRRTRGSGTTAGSTNQ